MRPKLLMTTKEVAEYLGFKSTRQIKDMVRKGYLKPRFLPNSSWRRFYQADVDALIEDEPWK